MCLNDPLIDGRTDSLREGEKEKISDKRLLKASVYLLDSEVLERADGEGERGEERCATYL